MKTCTKCGEEKPLDEFHRNKYSADMHRPDCKPCVLGRQKVARQSPDYKRRMSEYQAKWVELNREHLAGYKADWYRENREHCNEKSAQWYQENRERAAENSRRYREENREEIREYWRERNRREPHRTWESGYRTRCRQHGVEPVVERFTREELIQRWGDACVDCSEPWVEVDHVVPVVVGGEHTLSNCRPVCRPCNMRRWQDFLRAAIAAYVKREAA